jgi:hypothetical protein
MKKFLVLLLLLPTLLVGQITDTVVTTKQIEITETERIVDKYGSAIVTSFNKLITSATPMAEEGFKIAVKVQIAEGIVLLLPFLFAVIFMYITYREYFRISNILNTNDADKYPRYYFRSGPWHDDNLSFLLIVSVCMSAIFVLFAIFTTGPGVMRLIAPEWYAIKEIIQLLNPQ